MFGCVHFSFFKATADCHLTDAFALRLSSPPGAVGFLSGPFHCQGSIPNQDKYVQLGPKTYVPKELDCMNIGVVYMPALAPPRIFPPNRSKGDLALGLNTIHNCKVLCSEAPGCEHFSVQFPEGQCSLAAADATEIRFIESAISGRKGGSCRVAVNPAAAVMHAALGPHVWDRPKVAITRNANAVAIASVFVATAAVSAALSAALCRRFRDQRMPRPVLHQEASALLGETDV